MSEVEAVSEAPPSASMNLRVRILTEATRLFAERGYHATSMREIVEACGCTKPALYYYFKNKEALFLEVLRLETSTVTALVEREVSRMNAGEGSVEELMTEGLRTYLAHVAGAPVALRMLMRADLQPDEGQPAFDFDSLRATHLTMVKTMLRVGAERGEIRRDIDIEDAAYALSGIIDQRLRLWLEGTPLASDLPERIMGLFFGGVAERRGSSSGASGS